MILLLLDSPVGNKVNFGYIGEIKSPNYPVDYPSKSDVKYLIKAPSDEGYIEVVSEDFHVGHGSTCGDAKLMVSAPNGKYNSELMLAFT